MTPNPTTTKRRPTGRLFLLATILMFTASTTHALNLSDLGITFGLPAGYEACLADHETAEDCLTGVLPTQESVEPTGTDRGFIDQVETHSAATALTGIDLGFLTEALTSVPMVNLGHADAYAACIASGGLHSCSKTWLLQRPALPDSLGAEVSAALNEAWNKFNRNVIDHIHHELNTGEYCWSHTPFCTLMTILPGSQPPPLPRPDCIARKLLFAVPQAILEHYPIYVLESLQAIATHLPNAVVYGFDNEPVLNPITGSVVAPLFSPAHELTFDLSSLPIPLEDLANTDISTLSSETRAQIYYHEPYLAQLGIYINAPALPGEVTSSAPGVDAWEAAKRDFGPGTAIDQEYKGYAFLYQVQTPDTHHIFQRLPFEDEFTPLEPYKPASYARCLEGPPMFMFLVPTPIPVTLPKFVDRTIAVPEGHYIPGTDGGLHGFALP